MHHPVRAGATALVFAMLLAGAQPASGAWVRDQNDNQIDDAIENVNAAGYAQAFENDDVSQRKTIAVFDGAPLTYGVYVRYDRRPTETDAQALRDLGASAAKIYDFVDAIRSQASYEQLEAIRSLPGVTRIEAIPMVYSLNHYGTRVTRAKDSRGLSRFENEVLFPSARGTLGYDGAGIVIAILDTGVNDAPDVANPGFPGHESVAGKFLGGGDFYSGQPILNTQPDSSLNPDDHGAEVSSYHATHVAGTALGRGGADGFFGGAAPAARLVDCKVLSDAGAGFGSADGIEWCLHNKDNGWGLTGADTIYAGIDIISMSLGCIGCSGDGTSTEEELVDRAMREGVAVVIATGNDDSQNLITSPASADSSISVGASFHQKTLDRGDDRVTDFSNEGVRADDGDLDHVDEMKPSVVAPGANIISADGDPVAGDGTGYKPLSGTSMSTPLVAGCVALIRQANPAIAPMEIRSILQNTAEHFVPTSKVAPAIQPANDPFGIDPNYNPACGWGTIDTYAAIKEALNSTSGVQVVKIRATARPLDGEIDVRWVTQREHLFQGFNVSRAPDASGAPGTFAQINTVVVAPAGDPVIEADDNRTNYVFVDDDTTLVLGEKYWYRVDWVDNGFASNPEPAVSVTFGEAPRLATVYYSIAHNEPDTDLTITLGSSNTYEPLNSQIAFVGLSKEANRDSVVLIGPANAGTATIGNEDQFWQIALTEDDGVAPYVPPVLAPVAKPWFLNVLEGHFVNRAGRITSFSMFVNDTPGSSSGNTYVTSSPLPAPTAEGQATTVWIPDRTVDVATSRLVADGERGAVRLTLDLGRASAGATVLVSRAPSPSFDARAPLSDAPVPVYGSTYEYVDRAVERGVTYWYWVQVSDGRGGSYMAGPVSARARTAEHEFSFARFAGPNPLTERGTIQYAIGADVAADGPVPVTITIHDVQGRVVRTLRDGTEGTGQYQATWDARDEGGRLVAAGMYLFRFQAGETTRTGKMAVVR